MKLFTSARTIHALMVLIIFSVAVFFNASSTGITGQTRKNGTGCTCHGNASTSVTVQISGPDTLQPGQTGQYTLTISGGPLTRGGTNIAASAGTLSAGTGLRLSGGELTHSSPALPSGGKVTFQFNYQAPATATVCTLYANGNSVNFNGNNSGDQWNFAPNKSIQVLAVTSVAPNSIVPATTRLLQNFPNPFNPETVISYETAQSGLVSLKIYNLLGKEVVSLVNTVQPAGAHSVKFFGGSLPSGIYYSRLEVGRYSEVRKMILLK